MKMQLYKTFALFPILIKLKNCYNGILKEIYLGGNMCKELSKAKTYIFL